MSKYNEKELATMMNFIIDYISERECKINLFGDGYDCMNCEKIDECYMEAESRFDECKNGIRRDDYDTEEEFLKQLFD